MNPETRAYVMKLLGDTKPPPSRAALMSAVALLKDKYPELAKQLVAKEIALASADQSRSVPTTTTPGAVTPGGEPALSTDLQNQIASAIASGDPARMLALARTLQAGGHLMAATDLSAQAAQAAQAKAALPGPTVTPNASTSPSSRFAFDRAARSN